MKSRNFFNNFRYFRSLSLLEDEEDAPSEGFLFFLEKRRSMVLEDSGFFYIDKSLESAKA